MIIYHGISLIFTSFLILLVGVYKPRWILFWMDNPSRMMVIVVSALVFMGGAVLFGEGNKQKQLEKQTAVVKTDTPVGDKPTPADKPAPAQTTPAQAPDTAANELRP